MYLFVYQTNTIGLLNLKMGIVYLSGKLMDQLKGISSFLV